MTYGRVYGAAQVRGAESADVSHSAELVRGDFPASTQGSLIRPFGAPSPQGAKGHGSTVGVR